MPNRSNTSIFRTPFTKSTFTSYLSTLKEILSESFDPLHATKLARLLEVGINQLEAVADGQLSISTKLPNGVNVWRDIFFMPPAGESLPNENEFLAEVVGFTAIQQDTRRTISFIFRIKKENGGKFIKLEYIRFILFDVRRQKQIYRKDFIPRAQEDISELPSIIIEELTKGLTIETSQ